MIGITAGAKSDNTDLRVWLAVFIYLIVSAIFFFAAGFRVTTIDAAGMCGLSLIGALVSIGAIRAMPDARLVRGLNTLFQQAIYGLASAILGYAAACTHMPLADARMLSIDRFVGYDWHAYVAAVVARPMLEHILTIAYDSLFGVVTFITFIASMQRNKKLLQHFVVANMFALWLTFALFAFLPETTSWVYLRTDPSVLHELHLRADGWPQQLLAIRAGLVREVTPSSNFGIVGFPSYHCAAGLINIWVAWRSRWLRWPIVAVTVPMIAATLIDGGHYLSDLIGAAVITPMSIALAKRFILWAPGAKQPHYEPSFLVEV